MTAAQKKAFVARMKAARKKNPSNKSKSKAGGKKKNHSHSNPSRRKSRKGTRNPQILGRSPKSLFIQILTALIAGAATKQLPQELMAASNTGWKGYLANLATGGAATLGAHALLGPDEAFAAALGSGVVILDRVLTENFSPIGNYLALTGLGDATAARQLGGVGDGYFIQPTIYDANGNPVIPHQITDMAVQRFLALQPAQTQQQPGPQMQKQLAGAPGRFRRGMGGN